jgi:cyclic-di-GMP phosphodiesterase TipF (flagellum assembly factor)
MATSLLSKFRVEPALKAPLISALLGLAAAIGISVVAAPAFALPLGLGVMGLASLSALLALDARRRHEADELARSVGELNVRLASTRIKLDGLQSRIDSEPLREADIAPTRLALSELTAEVGLLGGVLRDVANAVADHEGQLRAKAQAAEDVSARGQAAQAARAPLVAQRPGQAVPAVEPPPAAPPAELVEAGRRRRDEARLASVLDAFNAGGLEIHLQPVVAIPHRRTVGYEALARLKLSDGSLLMPAEFIAALEGAGMGSSLDAQVLTQSLAIAGHLNARGLDHFISINLSSGTWSDTRALGSVARVLEAYRPQAARLIIEIPQRTWRALDPARLGIIGAMAAGGLRFALDQVSDLRIDPAALADRGVRQVKVSAIVLAGLVERSPGLEIDGADLASLLRRSGIELVGERAETDRLVADLIELDIRLAQGFAISQPRPVKPEVFQPSPRPDAVEAGSSGGEPLFDGGPAAAAPAAPKSGPPAPEQARPSAAEGPARLSSTRPALAAPASAQGAASEERLPFRAVLRRA